MSPLDMVTLSPLMQRTSGRPEISIGLIDGPVSLHHPDLAGQKIRAVSDKAGVFCSRAESNACTHGTFVAGILCARRGSSAPAICPGCSLLVRPIFTESSGGNGAMPSTTPEELALAIIETVHAGARVLNLSAAMARPSIQGSNVLTEALDYAVDRGVIAVAAAGNQGTVGSSAITRHPWIIPVVGSDGLGRPLPESNLGSSVGRQGLSAPGESITSLGANGKSQTLSGTSVAAPFVSGTIALLWSEFPNASAASIKMAVTQFGGRRRRTIVPPQLDAWAGYGMLVALHEKQNIS
jgi:subtilisin family serine protease